MGNAPSETANSLETLTSDERTLKLVSLGKQSRGLESDGDLVGEQKEELAFVLSEGGCRQATLNAHGPYDPSV
jgi:hypothetical protein